MSKAKAEDKALAVVDVNNYAIVSGGLSFKELIDVNLGGEKIDASLLDRVTFPSGRSTSFIMVNENGEEEDRKEFQGVIVYSQLHRAMFASDEITNEPPVCASRDMKTGYGEPGGDCESCAYNEWGTATKGKGKRCKEKRELHILMEGDDLPVLLDVPTASLQVIKKYLFRMSNKQHLFKHEIITKFSLKQVNNGTTDYAELVVTLVGPIPPEQKRVFGKYAANYETMITGRPPEWAKLIMSDSGKMAPDAQAELQMEADVQF